MDKDQVKGKLSELTGKAKQAWDDATDDTGKKMEGLGDKLQDTFGDVKDKFMDAFESGKDKVQDTFESAKDKVKDTANEEREHAEEHHEMPSR